MTRVSKRHITFTVDGVEYAGEASAFSISAAESDADFKTFADALAGGATDFTLKLTFAQDHAANSLWRLMWDNTGDEVDVLYRPYGNATASVSQPHYSFSVTIKLADGDVMGGEADASTTAVNTVEVEWKLTAKPTEITS